MSHKIQITVDDQLNEIIKEQAKKIGLSISSYARLVLINFVKQKKVNLLDRAIRDIDSNNVEFLTLSEFNKKINKL